MDYLWKFLLFLLTYSFIIIKKIKGFFKLCLGMLYHRQKRAKLFRSLIIDEEEIMSRIERLQKRPSEVIICLGGEKQRVDVVERKVGEIVGWTQRLDIKKHKMYSLRPEVQLNVTQCQSFKSFYTKFIEDINNSTYQRQTSSCPLILVFNSIPYMSGLPFSDIKGGEIMFCGELDGFSIVDYQEQFLNYLGALKGMLEQNRDWENE